MPKTSASYEKGDPWTVEKTDLRNLSDEQLVEVCRGNGRHAWDEFFHRFIPDIKQGIRSQLKSCGRQDLCYNDDVLADIHEKIVVKLYSRGKLSQCANASGIRSWLRTVAQNQTKDWCKKQNRKKRLPQRQTENSTISLSSLLRGYLDLTIADTIADESEIDNELTGYVEQILEYMSEIDSKKKLWVLRLSIISRLPLSDKEVRELASFSGLTVDSLRLRLTTIMKDVEAKEKKRLKAASNAVGLWFEIRRMEAMLHEKSKDLPVANTQEIQELKRQIEKQSKKREEWLRQTLILCRPSNCDIAELVGISEKNANQISNILIRARDALQELNTRNSTYKESPVETNARFGR